MWWWLTVICVIAVIWFVGFTALASIKERYKNDETFLYPSDELAGWNLDNIKLPSARKDEQDVILPYFLDANNRIVEQEHVQKLKAEGVLEQVQPSTLSLQVKQQKKVQPSALPKRVAPPPSGNINPKKPFNKQNNKNNRAKRLRKRR